MTFRRLAIAVLAVPFLAGCVSNETLGTRPTPAGGALFTSYVALGTSIAAGIQSGGINDSTQKQAYPYLLAVAMGLTPGQDWRYPKLSMPGCPPPYDSILGQHRIAVVPGGCALRDPATASPYENNLGIPSIRVAQLLNITRLDFKPTDTLGLAQFIVGSVNPIDMMAAAHPTFVTLEIGANDVLGAATRGTTALLTPIDTFELYFGRVADKIDATGAKVAVANVPNVTRIPQFTKASTLFCLKTGACGIPATAPFSSASFLVAANCAPGAAGGVGDTYLLNLTMTANIAGALGAGGAAKLDCANDTALVNLGSGFVTPPGAATINPTEFATIGTLVTAMNAYISAQATARGWALVDLDGVLAANAASVPPIPNLSGPAINLMGTLFSEDGVHPKLAGHQLIANAFRAAINAKFGTGI
jgi:lysophospholipase L1-like esterase